MANLRTVVLAAFLAGACGCEVAQPRPAPRPELAPLIAQLGKDNPFVVAPVEARILERGASAIPGLEAAAQKPPCPPDQADRLRKGAIRLIGQIGAKAAAARDPAIESLVRIALASDPKASVHAIARLKAFDRGLVLSKLARDATGPSDAHRREARVVMVLMDKKASIDLMVALLTGERAGPWPREEAKARQGCMVEALQRWTYRDLGYNDAIDDGERLKAAQRWGAWWRKNRQYFERPFDLSQIRRDFEETGTTKRKK